MGTEWDQETFVHNQLNLYPCWARISVPSFGCKDEEMQVSMCLMPLGTRRGHNRPLHTHLSRSGGVVEQHNPEPECLLSILPRSVSAGELSCAAVLVGRGHTTRAKSFGVKIARCSDQ